MGFWANFLVISFFIGIGFVLGFLFYRVSRKRREREEMYREYLKFRSEYDYLKENHPVEPKKKNPSGGIEAGFRTIMSKGFKKRK